MDTLNHDDSEIKRRLSEMTRRITVYRVNEKALTRRYQIMEEMDGQHRKVLLWCLSLYLSFAQVTHMVDALRKFLITWNSERYRTKPILSYA